VVVVLVAEPEVVFVAVESQVFAPVSVAAELSLEVVVLAVAPVLVSESGVVFVAGAFAAGVAEPRVSVDTAVAFAVLVPVSVVLVEVDSPGHPTFFAFPSIDCYASPSSSAEVLSKESVHNSTGARTNYGLCSILSSLGPHHNKNLEHCYNNPSPGYNTVSDTNHLAKDATTSHSRRTGPHLSREQRKHWEHQGPLSHPVAPQTLWAAVGQC
jgi:hypothetical protein